MLVLALALLAPLFTSCTAKETYPAPCGYPAGISLGNSSVESIFAGACGGSFGSTGVTVQLRVGQTLTVHFGEDGIATARSLHPKVLELTEENSNEQRFQAVAPGESEILYSPPMNEPGVCLDNSGQTMAVPCVVSEVKVTKACSGTEFAGSCKSSADKGATGSNVSKAEIPPSVAALKAEQSPFAVMCKPGFFTKAQAQLLAQQFGFIECFRFSGENLWVVFGDGYPRRTKFPSAGLTRGGEILALKKCPRSDTACLDQSAVHNFSRFTVYYPPDTAADSPALLHATFYGNLLSLSDSRYCSPITFDMTNGKWYPRTARVNLLETSPGTIQSLKAPAPVSGAKALTQKAPPASVSTC